MAEVTVIGLGAMGSALAKAFLTAKHRTTVWNRNPAKAAPLVKEGAFHANSVQEAVAASPLVVVCVDNYESTHALLLADAVRDGLVGRTIVQLSSGSPSEARSAQGEFSRRGIKCLCGAVMAYPSEVGRSDAMILISGPEEIFRTHEATLGALAGDLRYLGEPIGAAPALDMALLTYGLGTIIGVIQGALICESEGVSVADYGAMFGEHRSLLMGERTRDRAQRIHDNRFSDTGAALAVWGAALSGITAHCRARGMNTDFLDHLSEKFRQAETLGLGQMDVAALVKVLRTGV